MARTINPYRTVHKAHRARLFALSTDAGRSEPTRQALHPLVDRAQQLITELREHTGHEDRFVHPVLSACAPEIVEELEAQHEQLEPVFEQLTAAGVHIVSAQADDLTEAAHAFYLALSQVISRYLAHLHTEESLAWPALARAAGDRDVASQITGAFHACMSADFRLHEAADRLPHISPHERIAVTADALAGAPRAQHPHTLAFLTARLDAAAVEQLRAAFPA
ncbi:hemerythrin domain-containing protein [Streptomyces sp. NPDC101151]|uniref:hemerythrin domain-containing protein n=1 Tax=Streptomyces sp. NPDC101151 TaxID=3366115 RepID=UPI00380E4556